MKTKNLLALCLMQLIPICVYGQFSYSHDAKTVTINGTTINKPSHTVSSTRTNSSSKTSDVITNGVTNLLFDLLFNSSSNNNSSAIIQAAAVEKYNKEQASIKYQFNQNKKDLKDDLKGDFDLPDEMDLKRYEVGLSFEPNIAQGEITTGKPLFGEKSGSGIMEQAKELTDMWFNAFGSTMSASIEQLPLNPVHKFIFSTIVTAEINVGKAVNQGKPLNDATTWKNIAATTGIKLITPKIAGRLEPFIGEKTSKIITKTTLGAADDIRKGKNAKYIAINATITVGSEVVGASVPNDGWAYKIGSKTVAKKLFLNTDKNK